MQEVIINVEGMACEGCEKRIQNALMTLNGVNEVVASHTAKTVKIKFENNVTLEELKEKISDLGFEVE